MKKNTQKKKTSQHDKKVLEITRAHKRDGWNVRADLPGYKKPNPIGRSKRIPDIQATKRGTTRIYEVETKKSSKTDINQRKTFQRYAAKKPKTTFKTINTKKSSTARKKR